MKKTYQPETGLIRKQVARSQYQEHSVPLYLTSSFVFEDAEEMRAAFAEEKERNLYTRYSNPNNEEFIDKICFLEGAESGFAFATGMAAVYSTLAALVSAGDHILSSGTIFGATHSLFTKYFPKWNITTSYFDGNDLSTVEAKITPKTKILYAESPTNPSVDVLDLEALGKIAKKHGLLFVVDNCFATPYLQQPIRFGADLVIHSATKLIDGQGRVLGGVTAGRADLIREVYLFARMSGPALSPFNAWLLSKSLETLPVRVERQSKNALQLATYLEGHDLVSKVKYPFLKSHPQHTVAKKQMKLGGTIIAFELEGGLDAGKAFLDGLQMTSLTSNLGDSRTIATHPASTTHKGLTEAERLAVGIAPGLVRISVGLEHIEDIRADISQALEACKASLVSVSTKTTINN